MSATIWKFVLNLADEQDVLMPEGAAILSCQVQNGTPCIWALVRPDAPTQEVRRIQIFGTGHPMDVTPKVFVGTFQIHGGALVFHVFEVPK